MKRPGRGGRSETNAAREQAMKRVRLTMVLGIEGVAEGTLEETMPASTAPMMTMTVSQQTLAPPGDQVVCGPPAPDTIPIHDNQIAQHLEAADVPEDLGHFLQSEHGRRWYENWRSGQVDDDMVVARWGKQVLELSAVTGTIEDDPRALDTQKGDIGQVTKAEQRKEEVIKEGAVLTNCAGYITPEADATLTEGVEAGDTENDIMDEEVLGQQNDDVVLIPTKDFEALIHKLLNDMDGMLKSPKPNASVGSSGN